MYHSVITEDSQNLDLVLELADRVRIARAGKPWTQIELAAAARVSRATVVRIESGIGTPHMRTVRALAEAFGLAPSELFPDLARLWAGPSVRKVRSG